MNKISRWFVLHPYWALTLVVLAALGPFLAKPFNLDDPLFIWVAQQIYLHPTNPYGFDVNWAQTVFPMWNCTENPPLACYYLALGAGFFGWSEIGLHFAFVLPALAVICGTHRLARHFCDRPMLAALATLFTPVFLVSSLTVMCDVLMLAFWVWAVVWWVEGMERDDFGRLAVSGLFIALAALTKYYGVCLVPLLGAYGLLIKGRPGRWIDRLGAELQIPFVGGTRSQPGRLADQDRVRQGTGTVLQELFDQEFRPAAAGLLAVSGCKRDVARQWFLTERLERQKLAEEV